MTVFWEYNHTEKKKKKTTPLFMVQPARQAYFQLLRRASVDFSQTGVTSGIYYHPPNKEMKLLGAIITNDLKWHQNKLNITNKDYK